MLLVKECNYADEDRKVRDQFVHGVSDEELKKTLLERRILSHELKLLRLAKPI